MPSLLRFAFVAAVITGLAVIAVAGSSRLSGPVILTFSATHGLHRDEVSLREPVLPCLELLALDLFRSCP